MESRVSRVGLCAAMMAERSFSAVGRSQAATFKAISARASHAFVDFVVRALDRSY